MSAATRIEEVLQQLGANADAAKQRLLEILRIPSVSTDPAFAEGCVSAAEWFRQQLAELGFDAAVHPTEGHPVVLARRDGAPGAPHVLFYGHYDVQPPDPLELWDSGPFDPQIVEGPLGPRVVARGATDDKGQSLTWLEALRAWHDAAGGPPVGVTVLVEGEEEIGSRHLEPFLAAHQDTLRADLAIISDTPMWSIDTPAIVTRLRGAVITEVTLRGPDHDLHSGLFGGSALNPIHALADLLSGLHGDDGRVMLPGFYDGIAEPTPVEVREWVALGYDEAAALREIGLSEPSGERGRSGLERLWARPTAEVNGIRGGYAGEGFKAVIPAEAAAKVSFRLVPGQDPDAVAATFERFCVERAPRGVAVDVRRYAAFPAFKSDSSDEQLRVARAALAPEFDNPVTTIGMGGGIPVVESFRRILGIDALVLGFGLNDDRLHSPNEKLELVCFRKGARSHARLLAGLAAGASR